MVQVQGGGGYTVVGVKGLVGPRGLWQSRDGRGLGVVGSRGSCIYG